LFDVGVNGSTDKEISSRSIWIGVGNEFPSLVGASVAFVGLLLPIWRLRLLMDRGRHLDTHFLRRRIQ
jgi:hypothetical protein